MFLSAKSQEKKYAENLSACFRKIAEETSGAAQESTELKNVKLDCQFYGKKFLLYIDKLFDLFPMGEPFLGLKITCPINKDLEMKIYRMFGKPLLKDRLEVVKSENSAFDRRVYMLARQNTIAAQIVFNPLFQSAVSDILKHCSSFEIKNKNITTFHALQKLKIDMDNFKTIMQSVSRLAEIL